MIQDILLPFLSVGLAELGDKTQLAIFCMSSESREHGKLLLGVMLAFALSTAIAVVLGNFAAAYIPVEYVKVAAGALFILLGLLTLFGKNNGARGCALKNPLLSGFILTFLAELGDKTQLTAALFATRLSPVLVFIGSLLALSVLSLIAIYAGKFVASRIDRRLISSIAGIMFILVGIAFALNLF